jgi:hypothetical protein
MAQRGKTRGKPQPSSPSLVGRAQSVQGRLSDLTEELWAKAVPTDPNFSAFRHDADGQG